MEYIEAYIKLIEKMLNMYLGECDGYYTYNVPTILIMNTQELIKKTLYFIKKILDEESWIIFMDKLEELIPTKCPREGEFIAYKCCITGNNKELISYNNFLYKGNEKELVRIVKLRIPEDAKRSSFIEDKCRCNKAEVIDIYNPYTHKHYKIARSIYINNFIYRVGEIVKVDNYDEDRWNECSSGIHFFMTEEEATDYGIH